MSPLCNQGCPQDNARGYGYLLNINARSLPLKPGEKLYFFIDFIYITNQPGGKICDKQYIYGTVTGRTYEAGTLVSLRPACRVTAMHAPEGFQLVDPVRILW
jgi:hypothetical protein